jgi:hypothetical protein
MGATTMRLGSVNPRRGEGKVKGEKRRLIKIFQE